MTESSLPVPETAVKNYMAHLPLGQERNSMMARRISIGNRGNEFSFYDGWWDGIDHRITKLGHGSMIPSKLYIPDSYHDRILIFESHIV